MKTTQLEKDIAFCIAELDLSNEEIGYMLRACEYLGNISCEYFCYEFSGVGDTQEDNDRLHDENYLRINWGLN